MSDTPPSRLLRRELEKIAEEVSGELTVPEMVDAIRDFANELEDRKKHGDAGLPPDVDLSTLSDPNSVAEDARDVELTPESRESLRILLAGILKFGTKDISIDPTPDPFERLEISVTHDGLDDTIHLPGEAVQFTDESTVVRFDLSEEELVELEQLVAYLESDEDAEKQASNTGEARSLEEASGLGDASSAASASTADAAVTINEQNDLQVSERDSQSLADFISTVSSGQYDSAGPDAQDHNQFAPRPREDAQEEAPRADRDESDEIEVDAADPIEALAVLCRQNEPLIGYLESDRDLVCIRLEGPNLFRLNFDPPRPDRGLGHYLSEAGRIDEKQLNRVSEVADREDTSFADALAETGVLPRDLIQTAQRVRIRTLLMTVLESNFERATYRPVDSTADTFEHEPVSLVPFLFEHVYERVAQGNQEELEELKSRFRGKIIRPGPFDPENVEKLQADQRTCRFIENTLSESKPFGRLQRESALYESAIVKVLAALERLHVIEVGELDEDTAQQQRISDHLERLEVELTGDNHFDRLGVHWAAHEREIEEAYREADAELTKFEELDRWSEEERALIDRLRKNCEEAYRRLANQDRRRKYRTDEMGEYKIRQAIGVYEERLDTLKTQKDVDGLEDCCLRLLELDPGHNKANDLLQKVKRIREAEASD